MCPQISHIDPITHRLSHLIYIQIKYGLRVQKDCQLRNYLSSLESLPSIFISSTMIYTKTGRNVRGYSNTTLVIVDEHFVSVNHNTHSLRSFHSSRSASKPSNGSKEDVRHAAAAAAVLFVCTRYFVKRSVFARTNGQKFPITTEIRLNKIEFRIPLPPPHSNKRLIAAPTMGQFAHYNDNPASKPSNGCVDQLRHGDCVVRTLVLLLWQRRSVFRMNEL